MNSEKQSEKGQVTNEQKTEKSQDMNSDKVKENKNTNDIYIYIVRRKRKYNR